MRADIPAWIIEEMYRRQKERPFDTGVPLYVPVPDYPPTRAPEIDEDDGQLGEMDHHVEYLV